MRWSQRPLKTLCKEPPFLRPFFLPVGSSETAHQNWSLWRQYASSEHSWNGLRRDYFIVSKETRFGARFHLSQLAEKMVAKRVALCREFLTVSETTSWAFMLWVVSRAAYSLSLLKPWITLVHSRLHRDHLKLSIENNIWLTVRQPIYDRSGTWSPPLELPGQKKSFNGLT